MMDPFLDSTAVVDDGVELARRMDRDGYLYLRGLLPAARLQALRLAFLEIARQAGWLDRTRPLDFWTANLEQLDIGGYFDVSAAVGFSPTLLSELRGRLHSRNYWGYAGDGEGKVAGGVAISAGIVELPPMYFLGIPPGRRISFDVAARAWNFLTLLVQHNEPGLLAAFPYAQDAWSFYLSVDYGKVADAEKRKKGLD